VANVALEFIPPDEPDVAKLHVYESNAPDGSFAEIDTTTAIGTYPNYITRFTTTHASVVDDWFAIAWENEAGNLGDISAPMQGGSTSLVSEIVNRVMLRAPSLNATIVGQEAEAAVCEFYGVADPYSVDPATIPPNQISGLTLMTMARVYIYEAATLSVGAANKWTAGIVAMDSSVTSKSTTPWENIEKMLELANRELGRSYSIVLLLSEISLAHDRRMLKGEDLTRSTVEMYALP